MLGDWTSGFEATPADSNKIHEGDDEIRDGREETRIRAGRIANWGTADFGIGYSDDARMLPGTAKPFFQDATPTQGPRNPTNSDVIASPNSLTGALDQGTLWVDTDDNNRLKVYGTGGSWEDIHAAANIPTPIFGESTSSAGIGTAATTLAWNTTPTITLPSEGRWLILVSGHVQVKNTSNNSVSVRCDLELSSPTTETVDTLEIELRGNNSARAVFPFHYAAEATGGDTYTFVIKAAADNASRASFSGGTPTVSDAGFQTPANAQQHRLTIKALPR